MTLERQVKKARQTIVKDGYEMSIGELINMYRDGDLIINPDFQRLYRWSISQKTKFIESLLLDIPIPPIFVFTTGASKWELIDGLQRLSTIFEFVGVLKESVSEDEQPLRLEGTKLIPDLSGKKWQGSPGGKGDGLSSSLQRDIKRSRIRVEILKKESSPRSKYELFQRLNTGGSPLSQQEIRDCVLVMVDKTFHTWIKKLAEYAAFAKVIRATDVKVQKQYPTEMALRLLAYIYVPYDGKIDVHDYLDDAAVELATEAITDRKKVASDFKRVFSYLYESLGENTFRKWEKGRHLGRSSLVAFEFVSYGVYINLPSISRLAKTKRTSFLVKKVRGIWRNSIVRNNMKGGVRASSRLKELLPLAKEYFRP